MSKIDRVEVHEFTFEVANLGLVSKAMGIANIGYAKGGKLPISRCAVIIRTEDGLLGE